jgi:hypothetical protein
LDGVVDGLGLRRVGSWWHLHSHGCLSGSHQRHAPAAHIKVRITAGSLAIEGARPVIAVIPDVAQAVRDRQGGHDAA